jgi:hypothetical protein
MKWCSSCGNELEKTALFCGRCGTKQEFFDENFQKEFGEATELIMPAPPPPPVYEQQQPSPVYEEPAPPPPAYEQQPVHGQQPPRQQHFPPGQEPPQQQQHFPPGQMPRGQESYGQWNQHPGHRPPEPPPVMEAPPRKTGMPFAAKFALIAAAAVVAAAGLTLLFLFHWNRDDGDRPDGGYGLTDVSQQPSQTPQPSPTPEFNTNQTDPGTDSSPQLVNASISVTSTGLTGLKVGRQVTGSIMFMLSDGAYDTFITASDFTVRNLPPGLTAEPAERVSDKIVTVHITGTPAAYSAGTVTLALAENIPSYNVANAAGDIAINGIVTVGSVAMGDGADVEIPAAESVTQNSITAGFVSIFDNPGNQQTEYAIGTSTTAPNAGWQSSRTFSNLTTNTSYYLFVRSAANANYNAGTAQRSSAITTTSAISVTVTSTGLANLKVGRPVSGASVIYTLSNATYASSITPSNFTIAGLPAGLTAGTAQRASNTAVTITITGTPSAHTANSVTLTRSSSIHASNISGGTNAITPAGTITAGAVARGDGAAVSGPPTVSGTPTASSITVNPVTLPSNPGNQSVVYAISASSLTPESGWQNERTFNNLTSGTTYYVFARSAANTNYNTGAAQRSAAIGTLNPIITVTAAGLSGLKVGQPVSGARVVYTITNGTFASSVTSSSFTVSGLPSGLSAGGAQRTSNTTVTINITGAPTTYNSGSVTLTRASSIPASNVTGVSNSITPTGTITAGAVARGDGASAGTPSEQNKTQTSITVNPVNISSNPGNQSVEYAVSTGTSAPSSGWQSGTTFTNLSPNTTYYVFARSAANTNYNAGTAQRSAAIQTHANPTITVSASGLTGLKVGQPVSGARIEYTIANGTYASSITPSHFTVSGLPSGLSAGGAQRTSNTTVTINITGAPTTYSSGSVTLTRASSIPDSNITAASGAVMPTGTITAGAVARGDGAAVGTPSAQNVTTNSISVNSVTISNNPGNQSVEYAVSTSSSAPSSGWQSGTTFSNLSTNTSYYVYARSAANANYNAGTAQRSASIRTLANASITASASGLTNLKVGQPVSGSIVFTLNSGTYATSILPSNFTVSGLPAGLSAGTAVRADSTRVTVSVTGTPTAATSYNLILPSSVPASNVTGASGSVPVSPGSISLSAAKGDGAWVSPPAEQNTTSDSITISPVPPPANGQTVEYAISTSNATPGDWEWQTGTTFHGLTPNTTYYVFVRSAGNSNYNAGTAQWVMISTSGD